MVAAYIQPEAGRFDIEIIDAPHPVSEKRKTGGNDYLAGGPTKYVHFLINQVSRLIMSAEDVKTAPRVLIQSFQRTLPLGTSLAACGKRDDGWCELSTFLKTQRDDVARAEYNYACNG